MEGSTETRRFSLLMLWRGFSADGMIVGMVKKIGQTGVTNEKIMGVLLDMDERMVTKEDLTEALKDYPTKADLSETLKDFAKKSDLERFKEEILDEVRPLSKALDKDSKTVIDHGRRITVLERKVGIPTK